ncbi:MAG: efflux RND transporter periplasmic adaptor subunit [Deltaproteobacteria bacterium]|nr:efflux RND transporter periplasmic adaptor subunit [Deltaproteobacteria bacterium]
MRGYGKIFGGKGVFALLAALSLAVAVSSCGREEAPKAGKGNGAKAQAVRSVRVAAAEEGRLPRTVTVTGTLAADVDVVAGFKIPGRVIEIPVDLGTPVRKGQPLARLDPTDYRLRVQQAEAALRQVRASIGLSPEGADDKVDPEETALVREAGAVLQEARQNRDRMEQLWKKEYIARAEYDSSLSKLLVAEGRYQAAIEEVRNRAEVLSERRSGLELAKQQLADTILLAPFDGSVRERRASVGEYLAAGAPVVGLVKIHPLRLRVAVPERDAPAIRAGQVVMVRIEGDPVEHKGRVVRLSPSIQEQNRTLAVEAEVANPGGRLRPGAFARADIVVEAELPVVLAPASSVVTFAGIEKVFGVKDGRAVERKIRTGRRSGDRVEILEGLAAGEQVVVDPGNLVGGTPVTVMR